MNSVTPPRDLILASTSKYRKMLLERLALPFVCKSPKTDETAGINEAPADLVSRLATQKALVVATTVSTNSIQIAPRYNSEPCNKMK